MSFNMKQRDFKKKKTTKCNPLAEICSKISRVLSWPMPHPSAKFGRNPFIWFPVNLAGKQTNQPTNAHGWKRDLFYRGGDR